MEHLAIYDFCQTIVDFETADEFISFIQKNKKTKTRLLDVIIQLFEISHVDHIIRNISDKCGNRISINKRLNLCKIKGLSEKEINYWAEKYYVEKIKPHLIDKVIESIKQNQARGYKIVIISASYHPFITLFQKEYCIDSVLSNEFMFSKEMCFLGKIKRKDCISKEKVNRLREYIEGIESKTDILYSYGDSYSDIPILKEAKHGIVVSHLYKKNWAKQNGLEELVWE